LEKRLGLAAEARDLNFKARNVKIPKPDSEHWRVNYLFDHRDKFWGFNLVRVSSASEAYPDRLDLSVAHRHKRYDKLGNRLLLRNFKNYYFGYQSGKFSKAQCEEFFDNAANFYEPTNPERHVPPDIDHGFAPIPIHYKSKQPFNKRWSDLRISRSDIHAYFNEHPINIGVLTGQPSLGLVDIDIDDTIALKFAYWFLPETKCTFGRASKPRSHWVYRVPKPKAHHQFKAKGMILEIRGNNRCTVFPGSVHESGELIEFESADNYDPFPSTWKHLKRAGSKNRYCY
jgi:hypothetical protein